MSSTSNVRATAFDAEVAAEDQAPPRTAQLQAYLDNRVADCERAVEKISAMRAGLDESLAAAEAELEQARTEARGEN